MIRSYSGLLNALFTCRIPSRSQFTIGFLRSIWNIFSANRLSESRIWIILIPHLNRSFNIVEKVLDGVFLVDGRLEMLEDLSAVTIVSRAANVYLDNSNSPSPQEYINQMPHRLCTRLFGWDWHSKFGSPFTFSPVSGCI